MKFTTLFGYKKSRETYQVYKKKISLIEIEIVKNEYLDLTLMIKIFITELYDSENMTGNEPI